MSETAIEFGMLTQEGEARSFKAGEAIFRQGDPAAELFVVESGTIEIHFGGKIIDTITPNGIFGEMALIDGGPRSATAIAATDARVVPVDERRFLFMVGHTPYFALNVMRLMAHRLRAATAAQVPAE